MIDERLYWLGFSSFPGIGPLRFKLLLEYFGSAQDAWNASYKDLVKIHLGEKLIRLFLDFRDTFSLDSFAKSLIEKKIQFIIFKDSQYPKLLNQIPDPPILLYVRGDISTLNEARPSIGVVGTRMISNYGRTVTEQLTAGLVEAGFTIVSGMAYGVDALAHKVAIDKGGRTIAVLGCGVDIIHPKSNTTLYWTIVKKAGCVVSEFPPGMIASKGLFPARNRIISGLSLGVVVTEGASDSGALITARYAAEQGREVFAIPGPITSRLSYGPTKLLKQGAKLVTEVGDILEELNIKSQISNVRNKIQKSNIVLTKEENRILESLENENLHFDELAGKCNIAATTLGGILSMMELKGLIKNCGNGDYAISS